MDLGDVCFAGWWCLEKEFHQCVIRRMDREYYLLVYEHLLLLC